MTRAEGVAAAIRKGLTNGHGSIVENGIVRTIRSEVQSLVEQRWIVVGTNVEGDKVAGDHENLECPIPRKVVEVRDRLDKFDSMTETVTVYSGRKDWVRLIGRYVKMEGGEALCEPDGLAG